MSNQAWKPRGGAVGVLAASVLSVLAAACAEAPVPTATGTTAAVDAAADTGTGDGGGTACVSDGDCPIATAPCQVGLCVAGMCVVRPLAQGWCSDGNPCTVEDACEAGKCLPGANSCQCQVDMDCTNRGNQDLCKGQLYCDTSQVPHACRVNPASFVYCAQTAATQCTATGCDPLTGKCVSTHRIDGTACNDGNPCSVESACQQGACQPSKASWCQCEADADCASANDDDACNGVLYCDTGAFPHTCRINEASVVHCAIKTDVPCLANSCDAKTGACAIGPVPDGAPCDDGDDKSKNEACLAGKCVAGVNIAICAADGDCADDGDLCNGLPYCDKSLGTCAINPATIVQCPSIIDTACVKNTCQPATAKCAMAPEPNSAPCDDGDSCTLGDFCLSGECKGGVFGCKCAGDAECADKDDGDLCNGLPFCNKATGTCETNPATVVTCKTVDDTDCLKAKCAPKNGQCELAQVATGTTCDDGEACTKGETCAAGQCGGGVFVCGCKTNADCPDDADLCNGVPYCDKAANPPVCKTSAASVVSCAPPAEGACVGEQCLPKTGKCTPGPLDDLTPCDDGNACTKDEFCKGAVCLGGVKTCACDKHADCQAKDDGDLCNGVWFCDKSAEAPQCKLSVASVVVCPPATQGPCLVNSCVPQTGQCGLQLAKAGAPCSDGDPCTQGDACAQGACASGPSICECQTHSDCAVKDDGDLCNGVWYCDQSGAKPVCKPNPAAKVYCPKSSPTPCLLDTCEPNTGKCVLQPAKTGTPCDDGQQCTAKDACAVGKCAGQALSCDDDDVCTQDGCDAAKGCVHKLVNCADGNDCTVDTCNGKTGACAFDAGPMDNVTCNADGNGCTVNDLCQGGACKAGPAVECSLVTGACEQALCSSKGASGYSCLVAARPDGVSCDDGKQCKFGATCAKGKCVAGKHDRLFKRDHAPAGGEGRWRAALEVPGVGFLVGGGRGLGLAAKGVPDAWWLAATTASGALQWQLTPPSPQAHAEVGVSALVDSGAGELVVAGTVATPSHGLQGQLLWLKPPTPGAPLAGPSTPTVVTTKLYGDPGADEVLAAAAAASSGGLAVAGGRAVGGTERPWVAQLSNIGQPQWVWLNQSVSEGRWQALVPRAGEAWLLAGRASPQQGDPAQVLVAHVDKQGKPLWSYSYGNPDPQQAAGLVELASGELALVGWRTVGAKHHHLQLRLDGQGKHRWQRISASHGYVGRAVAVRKGGYLAVGGETIAEATGDSDGWLLGVDPLGNEQWQLAHDGGGKDRVDALLPLADGGLLAVGQSTVAGKLRGLMLRTSTWGQASCAQAGGCLFKAADACDDGEPCTSDRCEGAKGCLHAGSPGAVCGVDGKCAFTSVCEAGACVPGPEQRLFARTYPALSGPVQSGIAIPGGGFAAAAAAAGKWHLHRFDERGERLWSRTYAVPAQSADAAVGLCARPGGGFALVGWRVCGATRCFHAVAADANGKLLWGDQPISAYESVGVACRVLPSGVIVSVGGVSQTSKPAPEMIGVGPDGAPAFHQTSSTYLTYLNKKWYEITSPRGHAVAAAASGGLLATGECVKLSRPYNKTYPTYAAGAWAARISASGAYLWARTYDMVGGTGGAPSAYSTMWAAGARPGGGYLVFLQRSAGAHALLVMNEAGDILWQRAMGGVAPHRRMAIHPDGGVTLVTQSPEEPNWLRLARRTKAGALFAERTWQIGWQTVAVNSPVAPLADGGMAFFANASIGLGVHPVLIRTDPWGHADCLSAGKCAELGAAGCDDGDPCTLASCAAKSGCKAVNSGLCDDGDPCTDDNCASPGSCAHPPTDCDDGDVCTADSCAKAAGSAPGGCQHAAVNCSDGNACTVDACDAKAGCFHSPKPGNDGKPCQALACGGGPGLCAAGECVLVAQGQAPGCVKASARRLCADVLAESPQAKDGQYWLDVDGAGPAEAALRTCDMSGGGWTHWVSDTLASDGAPWAGNGKVALCGVYHLGPITQGGEVARVYTGLPQHAAIRQRMLTQFKNGSGPSTPPLATAGWADGSPAGQASYSASSVTKYPVTCLDHDWKRRVDWIAPHSGKTLSLVIRHSPGSGYTFMVLSPSLWLK